MEYRITITQLKHADIFVLVFGALYNEIVGTLKAQGFAMDRCLYNEITKLAQEIKSDWYNTTHRIQNDIYVDPINFASGFLVRSKFEHFVSLIKREIDLPKIIAPTRMGWAEENVFIYDEYIYGIVDITLE